ncbi:MAG: DUF262 domain-containing protein [Saprospiraceae bacterium]|nr:DUF262 domain-containing protein [Saprospiraceae bacterium]
MVYQEDTVNINEEILLSNEELVDNDLGSIIGETIKVYSRDWTVQTIYDQIVRGNIDLNPKFQRRNAWDDKRRSMLIESLMLDLPVPEIVLAESQDKKDSFVVLDGKQRLLTILGFINHEDTGYWDNPKLAKLEIKKGLNGKTYNDICTDELLAADRRAFENSSIRCTVIFGQKSDDLLYQIFYRLNSSSVPLSMQELRQALRKGSFSNFLIDVTNDKNNLQPIHRVLDLDEPDKRLLDAEIILKFIAFRLFGRSYGGNLKKFLDDAMKKINANWTEYESIVNNLYEDFNQAIEKLTIIFGGDNKIGRLANEKIFNRTIFDVQVLYFSKIDEALIQKNKEKFITNYNSFCRENSTFLATLKSRTTTKQNYVERFKAFEELVVQTFDINIGESFIDK